MTMKENGAASETPGGDTEKSFALRPPAVSSARTARIIASRHSSVRVSAQEL
jgi:hypothetical protein